MEHKEENLAESESIQVLKEEAEKHLKYSISLLNQLDKHYDGDEIPDDECSEVPASVLHKLNTIIKEYSILKLNILQSLEAKTITAGELKLTEPLHVDIFKMGLLTSLELIGNDLLVPKSNKGD